MPRTARRDAPGAVQHVMFRGIEKRNIFRDDLDRRDLVERLARLVPEESFLCFAWALMPNHVHLVLRTGASPLSRLMARLGTGYARRFNLRHGRVGHLFQNRFKSVLVESEEHLRVLVPYVHLNPVRAGVVADVAGLASYPWTGHAALMGRRPRRFLAASSVLAWFGGSPGDARPTLERCMSETLRATSEGAAHPALPAAHTARVRCRTRRHRCPGEDPPGPVDRLLARVCSQVGATPDFVLGGRRHAKTVVARSITAYLAVAELGLSVEDVASALHLNPSATSRCATRGRALLDQMR